MTLSYKHRIRNSSPGGLRPSTLPLGHGGSPQYFHTWMGKKHFCFFETAEPGNRTPNSSVKCSGANHHPRPPVHCGKHWGLSEITSRLQDVVDIGLWQRIRNFCGAMVLLATHAQCFLLVQNPDTD